MTLATDTTRPTNVITLAAYFYPATPARKRNVGAKDIYELHQFDSREPGRVRILASTAISGKVEAKRQAKIDGATPWNF